MAESESYNEKTAIKESFSHERLHDERPGRSVKWWHLQIIPKRYILALMFFLGFANVYALRVNMSVAIVAMNRNNSGDLNGTILWWSDFDWTPGVQGLVLSSFFWGYIVTQIPGGWLANRYGGKWLYVGGVLGTGVLTLITPPIAKLNIYLLLVVRIIEGLFEGVTFPAMMAMWAKWAPPLEKSKLSSIGFSGSSFGTLVAMPLSGVIAESLGWQWIFYIFGSLALVWSVAWIYLVFESPGLHPTIEQREVELIQQSIGYSDIQEKPGAVPWKSLCLSLPVWAIVFAHFAGNWGFYTMLTELPSFLHDVTAFNLYETGFISALPYLVMCIMSQLGGQLADLARSRKWLTTTQTRKIINTISFLVQAVCIVAAGYVTESMATVFFLVLVFGGEGLACSGYMVNSLDIAPQYASIIMGIENTVATIPGMVSPVLIGWIVQDKHSRSEWQVVFYIAGAIYCAGAIVFCLFASGEVQPWARVPIEYQVHLDDYADDDKDDEVGDK